ncbi:hypothetical protein COU78_03885 [Candidatus Peregrinibacteria bacterium CG10_big_fil_rev_8_21_14_0_10_49_24]|nr:MAG: hypothetical protein COV83_00505 [Candidatus Peregrinibacteria bacterium CG11_big_fil_rev_8_21_14_0_20_49_14]PIR50914.1 MAG: hypothetical protein COU78_03885 [Candidatus Peregrinibacteria bacterium CG10_big_fil_rev_8_21_14_0_10_49_24]PJA67339.1 MAG: hypothetical protein CO157_05100 [Candidatus Peregrinibacteria bacterium CG_4_9_14_3_um_filter_49_12]
MSRSAVHAGYALFPLAGALLLTLLLGYVLGRIVTVGVSVNAVEPMAIRADDSAAVPVVRIAGLENGRVVGTVNGDVRLWLGEEQIFASQSGTFSVKPGPFLINSVSVLVPDGMKYVASKRGKKYYGVRDAAGQSIIPENRLYFETADMAEAEGYSR